MQLEVDRVRHYPGGAWLDVDTRPIELTVAPDALLEAGLGNASAVASRMLKAPVPVTAYTIKMRTTTDAMIGTARVLTVSRISTTR